MLKLHPPSDQEIRSQYTAVVFYAIIMMIKLVAYFSTHVMALLAESFHSLSDLLISGFLLLALLWSRRGADRAHMFGHGRAQNVAALLAATLFISFTSYKLYEEAIPKLLHPGPVVQENLTIAIGVLVASMVLAAVPLVSMSRLKGLGAAVKAQRVELINDELGVLSALVGTIVISLGYPLADPIATMVIATIIAANAIKMFRDNLGLVIGQSPSTEYIEKVRQIALSTQGVLGIEGFWAEYIGPDAYHIDLQVRVAPGITIEQASEIAQNVRDAIMSGVDCQFCIVRPVPDTNYSIPSGR
jgi:cation diffusion facilitator family transporter